MIRAFTHVADVASGIILVMEHGRTGCAYNIGNPVNKTTILELARRVLSVTKSKSEITFVDPKTLFGPLFEEANDKYPDASRAMSELGWNPRFGLDDTIVDSFQYIRTGRVD
jgi:UDP-glucose 4-epimerase